LRQRSTRYTIRAGRNLPDKEFRYLRTVIVTADIHGDFGSTLRPACAELTSYHNLSALVTCHTLYVVFTTWQSAVFLVNSRLTHFTATRTTLATFISPLLKIASWGRFVLRSGLTIWRNHQSGAGTPSSEVTGLDCRVP
jgi:hypothetical protein